MAESFRKLKNWGERDFDKLAHFPFNVRSSGGSEFFLFGCFFFPGESIN